MDTTVTNAQSAPVWGGGNKPLEASYGKIMMWFFILSDALDIFRIFSLHTGFLGLSLWKPGQ